jgi:hypothetical protein
MEATAVQLRVNCRVATSTSSTTRRSVGGSPTSSYMTCSACGSISGERACARRIIVVCVANDFVMGFQYEAEALEMPVALRERLAVFGVTLHENKTRLIEFGNVSSERRQARGDRQSRRFHGFTPSEQLGWPQGASVTRQACCVLL